MFLGTGEQLRKTSDIGNIKIDKDEVRRIGRTKYLRGTIDESLSWNQKYEVVKGRLMGVLNSIRHLREMLPQS